jgi:hypothetical protein
MFMIDVEPLYFSDGQLHFALTAVKSSLMPSAGPQSRGSGIRHANLEYDWQVGRDDPNTCGENS